jgi:pimeloyl-ACP methyl ester carboxylesterase
VIISSCSYNGSFYYTKSKYNTIQDIKYEEVFLTNEEGLKLNAVYLEPEGYVKGSVLLIHGNGGNVSGWINSIEPLTKAGYRTLVFDYQGYGKSEGNPTHKNVVTDSELFLNYLISKKSNKNEKLIVWGCSLGGNLSVNIAYRNQDKVDILIDEAGFSSHSDIATEFMPWVLKPMARLTVKSPYKSKELISKIKIPMLIIHSTEDEVVPYRMGEKVFGNANNPKELWKIKGKHCYAISDYEKQFIQKLDSIVLTVKD